MDFTNKKFDYIEKKMGHVEWVMKIDYMGQVLCRYNLL